MSDRLGDAWRHPAGQRPSNYRLIHSIHRRRLSRCTAPPITVILNVAATIGKQERA